MSQRLKMYLFYAYVVVANATFLVNSTEIEPAMNRISEQAVPLINQVKMEAEELINIPAKELLTMPTPWTIDEIKPRLVFYKKDLPDYEIGYDADPQEVAKKLLNNGYLNSNRFVLITHGFHNNFNNTWMHDYKDLIFNVSAPNKYDQTVAILGWGGGADLFVFRYRQAAANVMPVGTWLADYTKAINDVKPKMPIYGIGHSLGAHVMGIAGRTSKVFNRITGLDPAGPCFEKVKDSPSLNRTDASFVDVIHTDGYDSRLDPSEWFFPVNHYGSLIPIGTIDYYPNYGYHQPGAGTFTVAGSHLRSLDLFSWSIMNKGKFITSAVLAQTPDFNEPVDKARPGQYPVEMGFYADTSSLPPANASTLFYLKTNSEDPWV